MSDAVLKYTQVRIAIYPPRPCPGPPIHDCTDRWHPRTVLLIPVNLTVHVLDTVSVKLVPDEGESNAD